MERWLALTVSGSQVIAIDTEIASNEIPTIQADHTWSLPTGDRTQAYNTMHQRVADYINDHHITLVLIKESASLPGKMAMSHLLGAELRGVVMCAAASTNIPTKTISASSINKGFGDRKINEYVNDDSFWTDKTSGHALRKGSRETAMLLLYEIKSR